MSRSSLFRCTLSTDNKKHHIAILSSLFTFEVNSQIAEFKYDTKLSFKKTMNVCIITVVVDNCFDVIHLIIVKLTLILIK